MKNHFFLSLIISSVFLSSCLSKADIDLVEEIPQKKLLLSKMITIYYDNPNNPETTVGTLSYNDDMQLVASDSDGRTATFEYDASGKPVKANYYKLDKTLEYYSLYSYNGDQLANIKSIYENASSNRNVFYTYDSKGKVETSTLCQTADCSGASKSSYVYNGDNVSVETNVLGGTIAYTYKVEFSYDDKLNPFTNINTNLRIMMGGAYTLSKNNYTTEKISSKNSDGTWTQNQNIFYTIEYNDSNLPTKIVGKDANGNKYVEQNYEYISK